MFANDYGGALIAVILKLLVPPPEPTKEFPPQPIGFFGLELLLRVPGLYAKLFDIWLFYAELASGLLEPAKTLRLALAGR